MRKVIMWLGRVPASVKKYAKKALGITTKMLQLLESGAALLITNLIPGETDEALRLTLIAILKAFKPLFEVAGTSAARKALAARVGAELTAAQDGRRERMGQYSIWFETVYQTEAGAA